MPRCTGKTKAGKRCQHDALKGSRRCAQHPADPTPKKARARKGKERTPKARRNWTPAFLKAFGETHLVTESAKRAGIVRDTAYDRRAKDPEFASAWAELEERSTELLEREAYRRAAVGTDKPVFQGGVRVGTVKEYSDTLLIFLLKSRRPDTYREHHRVQHVGHDGGPVDVRVELDEGQRKVLGDVLRGRPATRGQ